MNEPTVVAESKTGAADYVDLRALLANDNDDQESVVSGTTQRTVMVVGGVLKTSEDYVKHAAVLQKYIGTCTTAECHAPLPFGCATSI